MDNWLSRTMRRQARRYIERYRVAGRMLTVFPDDTFLVSYQKSGNTWLRFLLANLMCPRGPITLLEMEDRVPMIYDCSNWVLRQKPRPRIIASHECFDPRYRKVIYVVRDPRDVVISSYYHHLRLRRIPEGYPMELFVPRWLQETQYDSPRFGAWREHVLSWIETRGKDPGFLLVRYEDMNRNPQRELGRVSSFLSLDVSTERLAQAIELSSAERMRELEKQQHEVWKRTKGLRADVPFVRRAVAGGWKSALSESLVQAIEAECGAVMESLRYELKSKFNNLPTTKPLLKSVVVTGVNITKGAPA
jgi:Sulfotransferase domain